tara:strand:+ start:73 stop:1251 length:1179 start_codon:yes stop_codon:yes gene_type:complete
MDMNDYELLYRNSRAIDTSEDEYEDDSCEEEYIRNDEYGHNDDKNKKYYKKVFNFLIDSADRNWYTNQQIKYSFNTKGKKEPVIYNVNGTEIDTFDFKVKFGEGSNSIEDTLIFNPKTNKNELVSQKFYSIRSLSFPISIRNIESIKIQSVILPKRLIYLGEANYCSILDYRYLLVCIEEISNNYYGTHKDINKAIAVIYPLSAVYDSAALKQVEFIDKGGMIKQFTPTPLNSLNNLRFTIKDPNGNILNFKNDILTIKYLKNERDEEFIEITTNEYFNGEYMDGDIIKIKNYNSIYLDLNIFINREQGHKIYINTKFLDTTYTKVNILHNKFKILCPGEYTNGNWVKNNNFSFDSVDNTIGEILNTNLQLSILLKIETKTIEFDSLNTQII